MSQGMRRSCISRWMPPLVFLGVLACVQVAAAASAPQSDDFNSGSLNTSLWTVVNPLNDGTVSLNGSEAILSLPAGTQHDIWTGGDQALRIMQNIANVDFAVEAKFDGTKTAAAQMEGVLVEQDANNYLRFDHYYDGSALHLFVASFTAGSPTVLLNSKVGAAVAPNWLRVQRQGSTWTFYYSTNGTNFTQAVTFSRALTAARLGLFAGNCCGTTSPAFTSKVDYLHIIGPVITAVTANPTADSATIAWTTNVASTSLVSYGTTSAYGSAVGTGTLTTSHSLPVSGLACATVYHFSVSSADAVGNAASTPDATFTTSACAPPRTTPPVISGIAVDPSEVAAYVSWNTDEPSNSRVDFGTTASYGKVVTNSSLVTTHLMTLSGLSCNQVYHFAVTSTDANNNTATSSDATFSTTACSATGQPTSDDFHGSTLNTALWTIVNPVGDGTVSMDGTNLRLRLPAGTPHDVWSSGNASLRLMQTIGNKDFNVVLKFDLPGSAPSSMQGLLVEQDALNYVRFDLYRDCKYTHVFAAVFVNGTPTVKTNLSLDSSGRPVSNPVNDAGALGPIWLKVNRSGNTWTESWSLDGTNFLSAPSFNFVITTNRIGPFAGNCCGTTSPAFTSSIDYFFNTASPITPEDGGLTDKPVITPFAAAPPITSASPVIWVWYGDNQTFGQNGIPQQWVNVLGTVYGQNPISTLTYSLNGGAEQPLAMGQQYPRLVEPGDFNVEIDHNSLNAGANSVRVTATDNQGHVTQHTVTLNYVSGNSWPLPYSIDWSTVSNISDVAQIVDGKWQLQPDGTVRTMETGYDRLIAIGDMNTWSSYEVTAEITINTAYCKDFGVGIVTGWKGHTTVQFGQTLPDQPRTGHPFTGLGWWTNEVPKVPAGTSANEEIYCNTVAHPEHIMIAATRFLTFGVKYIYKFRVEPNLIGGSHYSLKIWPASSLEPSNWDMQVDGELNQGSILLATHHGDVSFGRVTIAPLQ